MIAGLLKIKIFKRGRVWIGSVQGAAEGISWSEHEIRKEAGKRSGSASGYPVRAFVKQKSRIAAACFAPPVGLEPTTY